MVLVSLFIFVVQRVHILMALMALEISILIITLFMLLSLGEGCVFLCIFILTIGACEASIGLALLVGISRRYGNDFFSSVN